MRRRSGGRRLRVGAWLTLVAFGASACAGDDNQDTATGGDAPFDFCAGAIHLLNLSRSADSFAKSKDWRFFPGDVNGDGVDDLVVVDERGFHFYYRPEILTEDPAIDVDALIAGDGGFSILDVEELGLEVAMVSGDVNGDGRDDVILYRAGAGYASLPRQFFVAFTPASGGAIELSTIGTEAPGLVINFDHEAWDGAVSDVADLNGDGLAEIIVGANGWGGDTYVEDTWIVAGQSESATLDLELFEFMSASQIRVLDADHDLKLAIDHSGGWDRRVSLARPPFTGFEPGAVDLSQFDAYSGGSNFFGKNAVLDVNGDGSDDLLVSGIVIFGGDWPELIDAENPGEHGFVIEGRGRREPLGDVNGDGRDDILVDASEDTPTGRFHVLFGDAYAGPLLLEVDLATARGYTIEGSVRYGDVLGGGPAGDVNDDGVDDFWIATSHAEEDLVVFGKTCP